MSDRGNLNPAGCSEVEGCRMSAESALHLVHAVVRRGGCGGGLDAAFRVGLGDGLWGRRVFVVVKAPLHEVEGVREGVVEVGDGVGHVVVRGETLDGLEVAP